jgi:hypothetical protein
MTTRAPRSERLRLSPKDREQLASLAELDIEAAKPALDRLERILDDHRFMTGVFGHPKPNEVRDAIAPRKGAGLKRKAEALLEATRQMPWQLAAELNANGSDLGQLQRLLKGLIASCDAVLPLYEAETTARRPPQRVRDRHTIPAIADLFDRLCGREPDADRDWGHLDEKCAFVTRALEAAGIPCPGAGDTDRSEAGQGRLRRLLKAHEERKRRHHGSRPQRAATPASPVRTD